MEGSVITSSNPSILDLEYILVAVASIGVCHHLNPDGNHGAFLLVQTVAAFGFSVFFSTLNALSSFAPMMVYLTFATIVSGRGRRIDSRTHSGETDKYLNKDSDDFKYETITARENRVGGFTNL